MRVESLASVQQTEAINRTIVRIITEWINGKVVASMTDRRECEYSDDGIANTKIKPLCKGNPHLPLDSSRKATAEIQRCPCERQTKSPVGPQKCENALYDRTLWQNTLANTCKYKYFCAQRMELQVERDHERRLYHRIHFNPTSHMFKALQLSSQRRSRQLALETATGKLLQPKQFSVYLNGNMVGANGLLVLTFIVDEKQH